MATSSLLPYFSVIIPTFNRPQGLQHCLEGLSALNYPRDRCEVLVVNDGGLHSPDSLIRSLGARSQIRLLHVPHGGPAAARNAGACEATGEVLAFTDDDCVPASGWLQALASGFSRAPDSLIGGRTLNSLDGNPYSTASQLLIDYLYEYYGRSSRPGRFFASNNLAVPTGAFRSLGGFDSSFTRAGGEDRELCDRWQGQGNELRYVPEAVVYHAHALSLRSFWQQHARYGRGAHRFHRLRTLRDGQQVRLEPPSFYAGLVGAPFRNDRVGQRTLLASLLLLSQISNAIGYYREALGTRLRRGC